MPTFRLSTRRLPAVPTVAGWLGQRGAEITPPPEGLGPWPAGAFRAHIPGMSTRPLALAVEGGRFTIVAPTLSSPEDLLLAAALAAFVAAAVGAAVEIDGSVPLVPADVLRTCHRAWAQSIVIKDCVDIVRRALVGVVTLPGPVRDAHIGPRLAAEIGSDATRWIALLRTVQYPSSEGIVTEGVAEWRRSDRGSVSVVAMSREIGPSLVPYAELVSLEGEDDEPVVVPFARLVDLAGGRVRALDERNLRADSFSRVEWDALVERARRYAVDDVGPDEEPTSPPRAGFGALALARATDDDTTDTSAGPAFLRTSGTRASLGEATPLPPRGRNLAVGVAATTLAIALPLLVGVGLLIAWWIR